MPAGGEWMGWVSLAMMALSGFAGIVTGHALDRARIKDLIEDRDYLLKGGTPPGTPVFMSRIDCLAYQDKCQSARCHEIARIQEELASQGEVLQALRNWAFWTMTEAGRPLDEINRILNEPRRRASDAIKK